MAVSPILIVAGLIVPAPSAPAVHTGICGHPLTQEGYRDVPLATQFDLVARLGVGWYRCDMPSDTATPAGLARMGTVLREAARRRIRVLPILFPPMDMTKDDEAAIRRTAREHARTIVGRFKAQVRVWELHNELDIFAMIRKGEPDTNGRVWEWGDADGDAPEHYEDGRYGKARAVLIGLAEGVRDADPKAERLINAAGWLHYGFIKRLVTDGVPFEILGWHWYSEMGDMTQARRVNVIEKIAEFGKPIWINEFNRRGGSMGATEAEYADTLSGMVRRYRELARTYPIRALMPYELLDEPYFGADNPESHYGLVPLVKGAEGRWTTGPPKPAFDALRRALRP